MESGLEVRYKYRQPGEYVGGSMIVKFDVYFDGEYWCARGIGEDIFTQGKTLDELMENLREAVELHFEEEIERGEEIIVMTLSQFEVPRVEQTASS